MSEEELFKESSSVLSTNGPLMDELINAKNYWTYERIIDSLSKHEKYKSRLLKLMLYYSMRCGEELLFFKLLKVGGVELWNDLAYDIADILLTCVYYYNTNSKALFYLFGYQITYRIEDYGFATKLSKIYSIRATFIEVLNDIELLPDIGKRYLLTKEQFQENSKKYNKTINDKY